ncbi:MAG TPA: site-specific DNA-methyltransferase [Spirochaetota bacterium]|nr:site-specific DNA-methyltransferase [Spirochaetota bacterium]
MIESLINTVIQGDCLDVMKSMPDKCVDLVLTDPPYGLGERLSRGAGKHKNSRMRLDYENGSQWDEKPDERYFNEMYRISKNQIIWGGNYFSMPPTRGIIVWDKKQMMPTFSQIEYAWSSFDRPAKMYSQRTIDEKEVRCHPTQKPINLMIWILQNYSEQGMTIFDPFAGSGTTAIACLETGRNYILVEKEPDYVEIINKRISTWKEQGKLFPAHVI